MYNLAATCALGLEAVVARELKNLQFENVESQNGQILFTGEARDICKANMWLRSADRVWLRLAEFPCRVFEDLFQGLKRIAWADIMPVNAAFPIDAHSHRSTLTSLPALQRTAKKAVAEVMMNKYRRNRLPEDGPEFSIKVFLANDICTVMMDTSGSGLHRRGYRTLNAIAPLRETLASALVQLSYWNKNRLLVDPFCGSGTICLEAAMLGLNMAPGLRRSFACQAWPFIGRRIVEDVRQEAEELFDRTTTLDIQGFDNDPEVLKLAAVHLRQSGLEGRGVRFAKQDAVKFHSNAEYGVIVTNPPYGERLMEREEAQDLYAVLGHIARELPTWCVYVISSDRELPHYFGTKPAKKRKVFNGMIECTYYQYPGPPCPKEMR